MSAFDPFYGLATVATVSSMGGRIADLEADNARLRDLVAKFQRGGVSDKFEEHGA